MTTLFLISPARCSGERAGLLVSSRRSVMARQLRAQGAELGDVFAWLSALYFRGKLTYARAFAAPPPGLPGVLVMAPGAGLRAPETRISADELRAMGAVRIESADFVQPLRRDAALLDRTHGASARVVLLGSIATGKYIDALLEIFGPRLVFPGAFVGRGDMSRGGLLLRAARSGDELDYVPVAGATLRGPRPPRLPRLPRCKDDVWTPPRAYSGEPYAVFTVQSGAIGFTTTWRRVDTPAARGLVADLLETRSRSLGTGELSSEANYAYVVLRRAPQSNDQGSEIGTNTPIAEFGYGGPPTSPEEWPLVELRVLLEAAVGVLRGQRSS